MVMAADFTECGVSPEEREEVRRRALEGKFKNGDIIRIPSLIIIDNDRRGVYGRVHELYQHYYLVVGEAERTLEGKHGERAKTDLQVVLIDGLHNNRLRSRAKLNKNYPVVHKGEGLPMDSEVNTDRLIYVTRELLLEREAEGVSLMPDREQFRAIKRRTRREGKQKENTLNLRFEREE